MVDNSLTGAQKRHQLVTVGVVEDRLQNDLRARKVKGSQVREHQGVPRLAVLPVAADVAGGTAQRVHVVGVSGDSQHPEVLEADAPAFSLLL